MPTDAITLSQLATLAGIAASIFAVLNVSLRWAGEYLHAKLGPERHEIKTHAEQAEQCRFDHGNINAIMTTQNATISKMLEQNSRMIDAMKDASHVSELRHQVVLGKLTELNYKLEHR